MRLKIRCDGESEKFCKIFWELNKAMDVYFSKKKLALVVFCSKFTELCGQWSQANFFFKREARQSLTAANAYALLFTQKPKTF
jgi:hypothetical protein